MVLAFSVNVDDRELRQFFNSFLANTPRLSSQMARGMATRYKNRLKREIKANHYASGYLFRSIRVIRTAKREWSVSAPGYIVPLERGTRPHFIPRKVKAEIWARRHGMTFKTMRAIIADRGTKPHPFTEDVDLSKYNNIISVKRNVDIMDLLIIADVLITDYSSVFYDYLLTLRPIIFFADDLEKYTEIRDFYYDYESFIPGPFAQTGEELIQSIKNVDLWNSEYEEKRKIMRDKFNKYSDGRATERIIEMLNLKTY